MKLRAVATALRDAFSLPTPWYLRPIEPELPVEPEEPSHLRCGVPDCPDGVVAFSDDKWTIMDCEPHNAFTRLDTHPPEPREQVVIRVQDRWGRYGTNPPRR